MNIRGHIPPLKGLFSKYAVELLLGASLVLFALSLITPSYQTQLNREIKRVERAIHKRQRLVDQYVLKAMQAPPDEMLAMDDMPEDIVLYRYILDTLQSWVHQFPIGNDALDVFSFSYKLQYQSNNNVYSAPLAYVGLSEQYVNLGTDWYVINRHISPERRIKIVTGIRIKTQYPYGNRGDAVNRRLRLGKGFTTVSLAEDDFGIVHGQNGDPLFSIVAERSDALSSWGAPLKWYSLLLATLALLLMHARWRSWKSLAIAMGGVFLLRGITFLLAGSSIGAEEIFSPLLYAENSLFDSLGSFLLNNLTVSLVVFILFISRHLYYNSAPVRRRGRWAAIPPLLGAGGLALYIHFTLHSLIINSNVVLEPFRLNDVSWYMVVCYLSYALLFLALFHLIAIFRHLAWERGEAERFSGRSILVYSILIAAYCVVAEGYFGLEKEYESNRVRAAKLSLERDYQIEIDLRTVEPAIAGDPFISVLSAVNGVELIKSRLADRYFSDALLRKYELKATLCSQADLLAAAPNTPAVNCYTFFTELIRDRGTQISPDSDFFYINNYDGKASYLGVFFYYPQGATDPSRLFVELTARYKEDPFDIFALQDDSSASLPARYSYARYSNWHLVMNDGSYRYSTTIPEGYQPGYIRTEKDGCVHFINSISEGEMTVITRSKHPFFPYLISFSYLLIFFGIFMLLTTAGMRDSRIIELPKHSLKRRITLTTTGVMMTALASVAATTILYIGNIRSERNRSQIQERITSVQAALNRFCSYASSSDELRTPLFMQNLEELSHIMNCDINIYDPSGQLLCSTSPELFERFIIGKRMNAKAFNEIVHRHALNYYGMEKLASRPFYAIYAPLTNVRGEMLAIANVPYLSRSQFLNQSISSTVAMIINLYLVLLIAALVLGIILSNSMIRPLIEIRNRLGALKATAGGNQKISYKNSRDELGVLVSAYNKMVDDLEESTRQLAASERERAWKEMARQIAHEIKNPLTPMRLSIQHLIRLKEQDAPNWQEKISPICTSLLEQIDVLSDTASEFSAIARSFSDDAQPTDMDQLLSEQVVLFDNRDNIFISYLCNARNTTLTVVRQQMARVFVNLLTNATQAIESGRGSGKIKVSLENVTVSGREAIRISVEDDGSGVAPEDESRLFTPNFTTKSGGSGLGLVISKSIVEQAGGTISYRRSEDLGGACFTLLFFP